MFTMAGHIDSISIAPNKTMRIIATIVGPIKRFVDMEVLVSEIDSFQCPIDPQVNYDPVKSFCPKNGCLDLSHYGE